MLLEVRRNIRSQTIADLARYRGLPRGALRGRLAQLDREWRMARALKAGVAALALGGCALGAAAHPRWLVLPAALAGLALYLRRSGLRARKEIEAERRVLHSMHLSR